MNEMPEIVEALANLFASHRIVPFLGAGCSLGHVRLDWDGVRDEMAAHLNSDDRDHAAVASAFVARFGRQDLAKFLCNRLHVPKFDASRGNAFMTMMGTSVGVMYTTNQDNLVELCFAEYGRELQVVVDIDDIAQLRPGDTILYKFHGDLAKPDSLVFSNEDYSRRGLASDFELDVRLRSDSLAKSLLFLGYSFRDPNVRELFGHLRQVFKGRVPQSFLIQFQANGAFEKELKDEFGITAIDPMTLYPGADVQSAFDRFLSDLTKATVAAKAKQELSEVFSPRVPPAQRIVTAIEIDAIDAVLSTGTCDDALRAFRATYDTAEIHAMFVARVAEQFVEICRRVDKPEQVGDIRGALFNLHLPDVGAYLTVSAAAHATANVLPKQKGFGGRILFLMPRLNEKARMLVVAHAIYFLREWGRQLTPTFYDHVSFWEGQGWLTRTELRTFAGKELVDSIEQQFDFAYQRGKTTYEHPLSRAERLSGSALGRGGFGTPGFAEILASFTSNMPKRFGKPHEG